MNDMTVCGNHEALVTYLYDECSAAERESMAAHLAICASCAEELQALSDTRAHLASWSPPAMPLGFQITRIESETPAQVLRPAAWYRQPLPAWAQVAAAALIFAAGMSVNALRSTNPPAVNEVASLPSAGSRLVTGNAARPSVSSEELARFEARLRSLEAAQGTQQLRTASGTIDERALFDRVSALVDEQMTRYQQRNEFQQIVTRGQVNEATEKLSQIDYEQQQQRHVIYKMAGTPQMAPWLNAAFLSTDGR